MISYRCAVLDLFKNRIPPPDKNPMRDVKQQIERELLDIEEQDWIDYVS